MKKAILSLASMALLLASCVPNTKDSYQTYSFPEYNMMVDTHDMDADAQASLSSYALKYNMSKNVIDIKTQDLVLNNQKYSFETDEMEFRSEMFKTENMGDAYNQVFSKSGAVSVGSVASNLNGKLVWCYMRDNSNLNDPNYRLAVTQRLDLSYILNDRYKVQTFWPAALYKGTSWATDSDGTTYTDKNTDYLTQIDFEKKKAALYIYNAALSEGQGQDYPKVICIDDLPIIFYHDGIKLESAAPKTTVLGKDDNKVAMIESSDYKVTDFSFAMTSQDLTDVEINFKLDGKSVSFRGCSILKAAN